MTATNGAPDPSRDTHFGFRSVGIDHKQAMVDEVFDKVAPRYDLMNDLMSGGLHRVWRDILVTTVNPPRSERSFSVLDAAGGTGDVAFRIVEAGGAGTRVTVCDINEQPLGHAAWWTWSLPAGTVTSTFSMRLRSLSISASSWWGQSQGWQDRKGVWGCQRTAAIGYLLSFLQPRTGITPWAP